MSQNYITKRDGRKVEFDTLKIKNAVLAAFKAVDGEVSTYAEEKSENITDYIYNKFLTEDRNFSVEEIQDLVEHGLMSSKRKDVAKAYVLYRNERNRTRTQNAKITKIITEKLTASNVENSNANVDEASFGGRMGEATNEMMKQYALDYCMSEMAKNNHLNNEIYIHDLSHYAIGDHNCLSIPFDDLLAKGFNTRQVDIRPANSINTAFQLIAVIFQIQSLQQFGGVSSTHLDWTMVPYVRKSFYKHYTDGMHYLEGREPDYEFRPDSPIDWEDYKIASPTAYQYALDMTTKEAYQAAEGLFHNLNSLQSRSGAQLPFTSINFGTCTLPEGRLIIRAILDGSIKGVGKFHKTSVFPCSIFQMMKGVNREPGDPNYDLYRLALKSTAQRLYPNYANCDWSGNAGYDPKDPRTFFSTMGCRTANGWDINGFGQLKDGRGNICPVTIIMPTLAMECKMDLEEDVTSDTSILVDKFLSKLDNKIHEAKDMLLERFEYICSQNPASAKFMYENGTMAGYVPEEGIRSALKHGTLAVGQLGLAETLQILIECDHTTEEGMKLAKRIEQLFKDRCAEFKKQYSLNFGVYYTPAESLCGTALKKFRERYGAIPNVSDREYFTNSMHVPVWKEFDPFEKIDIESQLTPFSSAGCITYVEIGNGAKNNLDALETIVNYAMDHDIPYFALNLPNDTCLECGYQDEFNDCCPECGSTHIQQLRRVTGYLSSDWRQFNPAKQAETADRIKHIRFGEQ